MKFVKLTCTDFPSFEYVNVEKIVRVFPEHDTGRSVVRLVDGTEFYDDRPPEALIAELCETAQERYWRLSREANPPAETAIEEATK